MKRTAGFVWNMIGSLCYSVSSMLFLIFVTRICGVSEGGNFSLAYATAQLLLTFGRYGMRTYQATDLNSQYSYGEYIASRVITVTLMLTLGVAYSLYAFDKTFVVSAILIIAMKSIDAIEDVYQGRLQQTYHVEQMGKSQAIRNIYTTICFAGTLLATKSLQVTLISTVITSLVLCIGLNQFMIHRYVIPSAADRMVKWRNVIALLKACTGIFCGTFLSLLLYNLPKYAMAGVLSTDYQTYYSVLFMPSFIVTMLCDFIFKPVIMRITEYWFDGFKKQFRQSIAACLGIIIMCSVFVTFAGHLIGRNMLEVLYGVDLMPYRLHFVLLLLGGGISACVYMIYNTLIAIRHGESIKIVYTIVTLISLIVVQPMIMRWGMMGAALNYVLGQSMLLVFFAKILYKDTIEN